MRQRGEQWKLEPADVKMDHIISISVVQYPAHHTLVWHIRPGLFRIGTQRTGMAGLERCPRYGISRCIKRHLMSEIDYDIREISDDPFRFAISLRRHTFRRRSNLCNAHMASFFGHVFLVKRLR